MLLVLFSNNNVALTSKFVQVLYHFRYNLSSVPRMSSKCIEHVSKCHEGEQNDISSNNLGQHALAVVPNPKEFLGRQVYPSRRNEKTPTSTIYSVLRRASLSPQSLGGIQPNKCGIRWPLRKRVLLNPVAQVAGVNFSLKSSTAQPRCRRVLSNLFRRLRLRFPSLLPHQAH